MMSYAKTYYLNFASLRSEEAIEKYIHAVTPARRARIETTKRPETKASLLGAGLLLKAVLKKEYGISDFETETNEFGKPFIKGSEDIRFNLSHSGDVAVCTVSDTDVGIDIENVSAPHDTMAVANKFFSRNEYAAMMLSPNPNEAFCRLWTLRESYVKMRGKGFAIGLSTMRCDFHRGVCSMYENHILQEDAFFREIKDIRGYRVSVCTKGECEHSVEEIKISDIA